LCHNSVLTSCIVGSGGGGNSSSSSSGGGAIPDPGSSRAKQQKKDKEFGSNLIYQQLLGLNGTDFDYIPQRIHNAP
jgi:hypothetical protein